MRVVTIVSGGQTGADRAALDAAMARGVRYRGWCPKGGWAEDSTEPPGVLVRYPGLKETPEQAPEQRTDWNVRDADALLVLVDGRGLAVSKGTARAVAQAQALRKPYLVIDVDRPDARGEAQAFLAARKNQAIGIGGPRESEAPGLYEKAKALLLDVLSPQALSPDGP